MINLTKPLSLLFLFIILRILPQNIKTREFNEPHKAADNTSDQDRH